MSSGQRPAPTRCCALRPAWALALVLAFLSSGPAHAQLPTPQQVRQNYRPSQAQLLDRHGVVIQSLRIDLQGRRMPWVALSEISPALPAAVLQAEDQRFYEHQGVDWSAAGKAAWDNLFRQRPRGASTITMQLAALLDPRLQASKQGRSWAQKWDQVQAARELDASWSKAQILEAYLNLVSFRGELQGVGAAARALFGKLPSGLTLTESMILASLLRGPNAAPALVWQRACALARELRAPASCSEIELRTLVAMGRPQIVQERTPAPQVAQQLLQRAGQQVRSTLDASLQQFAQTALHQQLMALRDRNVSDGAVLVLDNASGDILAYVANTGTGGTEVDGVMALRQAGSTLKPFLYELALERKLLTAASVMDDSAIDIATPTGLYVPQNYDKAFKGQVSVRTSLASSLNVPAVRTLVMTGLERFHRRLQQLGLSSLTEAADFYGYSLALGSAEVSLLELTNAYRVLANGGNYGGVRLSAASAPDLASQARRVLDAKASFIISDILSDRAARSITFGLQNQLATNYWSAVKTGTSKDMRDNWCIGYSDRYTVGVWVGNFDGQPMWDVSGVTGAAPAWREVMDYLHRQQPGRAPAVPAGVLAQQISYEPALEQGRREWFIAGTESAVITLVGQEQRAPKIIYPPESTIIAIDPDMPQGVQRVLFQAQAGKGLRWQLDGTLLGPASSSYPWLPTAGQHELALVDSANQMVVSSRFQVRGAGAELSSGSEYMIDSAVLR